MSGLELPENWVALTDDDSAFFSKEFYREADKSHPLYDERMWAIARRNYFDDFLFKVHDGRYAAIHLTWAVETTPHFPGFQLFETLDAWRDQLAEDANWPEGD